MALPRPRTVRAKLTLTTTLVMALVLVALGLLVDVGTHQALMRTIDSDLRYRADEFAATHGPRGGPGGPGGPPEGRGVFDLFGGGPGGPGGRRHFGRSSNQDDGRPRLVEAGALTGGHGGMRDVPYDVDEFRIALHTGRARPATVQRSGEPVRIYSEPILEGGRAVRVVQVGHPLGEVFDTLDEMRNLLLTVVLPLAILLVGGASLFIVGRALRPVRIIDGNARTIGGGNLEDRLPVVGQDEFAGLATTLNGMLARLEETFRLEQATTRRLAETVEQQRRFTADASHELKTPLATIKAHVGLLEPKDEDDRESLESIDDAANRMRGLVDDLLVLARADGGTLTARTAPVDLGQAVHRAVGAVSPLPIEVSDSAQPLVVEGNGEALVRLFINLLDNAKKYAGENAPVEVHLARRGDAAEVAVVDHGVGIAPEHLPKLFDRFYRPDVSRTSETGGTGLGLAICREIAAAHGGTIEVASRVGQGTAFTVVLPLASL